VAGDDCHIENRTVGPAVRLFNRAHESHHKGCASVAKTESPLVKRWLFYPSPSLRNVSGTSDTPKCAGTPIGAYVRFLG